MKPLVITPGEPAGIGPDIVLKLITQRTWEQPLVIISDKALLQQRAIALGLSPSLPDYCSTTPAPVSILHIPLAAPCQAGHPDLQNSYFVLQTLQRAAQGCLQGEFSALVTGPIHKALLNQAGIPFQGHTEYLAELATTQKSVMMFVYEHLRLVLLTTHLPLAKVPDAITPENITTTIDIVWQHLKNTCKIKQPKIAITGLNPHAGEQGYLGDEEQRIIEPTLNILRHKYPDLFGPLAADTVFQWIKQHPVDAIISMYHDQALPVIKALGFGQVVNVTLGLPFIRTSVDHGTAFDVAGTPQADATSLITATQLAIQLLKAKAS